MKKKLVGFLLIFTLTATGAAACGTADTNIDANAESSVQEEQVGISEEEKTEEAEEGDVSAENQKVNEYGLTDEEWNLLMDKYRANLAEWKAETGIDQERLTVFLTALLENPDSFSETCIKPMLEELIQTAQGV